MTNSWVPGMQSLPPSIASVSRPKARGQAIGAGVVLTWLEQCMWECYPVSFFIQVVHDFSGLLFPLEQRDSFLLPIQFGLLKQGFKSVTDVLKCGDFLLKD